MNLKLMLVAVGALSLLAGCSSAPQSRYAWNDYDNHLYDYQAQKISGEEMLSDLLDAVSEAEKRGVKLAPGLYAEIGTMYIRLNKPAEAPKYYRMEAETWPESASFMNTVADAIEKNLKKGAQ